MAKTPKAKKPKKQKSYLIVTMVAGDQVKEKNAKDALQEILDTGKTAMGDNYGIKIKDGSRVPIVEIKVKSDVHR